MPLGRIGLSVTAVIAVAVTELADAVGGEPVFHDGGILGILDRLAQGRLTKAALLRITEVAPFGIDAHGPVRGNGRPTRVAKGLLTHLLQGPAAQIVFEIKDQLALLLSRRIHLVQGAGYLESKIGIIPQAQFLQRQVPVIKRVPDDLGQLPGQFLVVKQFFFGSAHRIDQVPAGPLGGLPAVPESIGTGEPVRADRGGIDHLSDFLGRKTGGLVIIGGADRGPTGPLTRHLGAQGGRQQDDGRKQNKESFCHNM